MNRIDSKTEKKLKDLSSNYIYHEAVGSFLLLLMSCLEEEEKQKDQLPYGLSEDIVELKKEIHEYILHLEEILNAQGDTRIDALERCMALKKNILSIYKNIYPYFAILNAVSMPVNDEIAVRKYKEGNMAQKKIQFHEFYMDCEGFLNSCHTWVEQKNKMGQLLKCIPLQMAREKYFDFIKESLFLSFAHDSEPGIQNALNCLICSCAPETSQSYGTYFSEIAQWLSEQKNISPSTLSNEALKNKYDEFGSMLDTLSQIEDIFSCMFHDINSLIILFYLNYTFDELTENNTAYSDFYHLICEMPEYTPTERMAYLDTLHAQIEEAFEPVIDKINALNKKESSILKQIEDFDTLSDETNKILSSEGFIRFCYYSDINEEIFHFESEPNLPEAEKEFKNKKFTEFIQCMKDYFAALSPSVRKSFMLLLFSSLPPAFSVPQAMEYIKNAVNTAKSPEHKLLILDKAGIVFTDNHYETYQKDRHSHTDDCGWRHEHHCDCGHHHNHTL